MGNRINERELNMETSALIVVDIQNDFCPGGALAVQQGDEIVSVINRLAQRFENVILTQDWHPEGHASFASTHGRGEYSLIDMPYGSQVMWPDHCVQDSAGSKFHPALSVPHAQLVIRKGYRAGVDSYSAFKEADGVPTGLAGYLRERGIERVTVVGLATDFCVAWTAMDARQAGFEVEVIEKACRGIDVDGSLAKAWEAMAAAGVVRT